MSQPGDEPGDRTAIVYHKGIPDELDLVECCKEPGANAVQKDTSWETRALECMGVTTLNQTTL